MYTHQSSNVFHDICTYIVCTCYLVSVKTDEGNIVFMYLSNISSGNRLEMLFLPVCTKRAMHFYILLHSLYCYLGCFCCMMFIIFNRVYYLSCNMHLLNIVQQSMLYRSSISSGNRLDMLYLPVCANRAM